MKSILAAILTTLAYAGPLSAQAPDITRALFPEGNVHDFGTVERGKLVTHSFKLTNPYDVPLEILPARASSPCTTLTAKKKLIAPGQSTFVEVAVDTKRFVGRKTVTIYLLVQGRGMSREEAKLLISATSEEP